MNARGWTASHNELHRVRFLDWLHENTRHGTLPHIGHYSGSPRCEGGIEAEMLEAIAICCEQDGLIEIVGGMGRVADSSARLLPPGTREVHERRERRADRVAQMVACRDAFISWLYDLYLKDQDQPSISLFNPNVRGNFEGEPFDQAIINQAARYLLDKDLITGSMSSAGYPPRPKLTSKGIDCAEHYDSSVRQVLAWQARDSSVPTITVTGSGNALSLALGHQSQSSATSTTIDAEAAVLLAAALREALPVLGLAEDDEDEAQQQIEDIENGDESKRRTALRWFGRFANDSTASGLGQVLGTLAIGLAGDG